MMIPKATPTVTRAPGPRILNLVIAAACFAAAVASVALYLDDRSGRVPLESFVREYTLDERRPDAAASARLAIAPDLAADVLADAALRDAVEPVDLLNASDARRALWVAAAARVDDELAGARNLMTDAIATRPGWSYHYNLLGRAVFARLSRNVDPALVSTPEVWARPMIAATNAAPNAAGVWESLAFAYLSTWPQLGAKHAGAERALKQAFLEEYFVARAFPAAVALLGPEPAAAMLPDQARSLRTGFEELLKAGAVDAALDGYRRWEAAEWRDRQRDMDLLEKRAAHLDRDSDELRQLCASWVWLHSVWDYDSPAARSQAARVLELWPATSRGKWNADPRADLVRYLLTGRPSGAAAAAMARAVELLDEVPDPVRASIALLAGNIDAAERFANAPQTMVSEGWSSFVTEMADYYIRRSNYDRAAALLARLGPDERQTCDSVGVERRLMIARSKDGNTAAVGALDAQIAARQAILASQTASKGELRVCVGQESTIYISVDVPQRTFVSFGVDGVRRGATVVDGHAVIAVDSGTLAAERTIFVRPFPENVEISSMHRTDSASVMTTTGGGS